jgi:hypothetical protein
LTCCSLQFSKHQNGSRIRIKKIPIRKTAKKLWLPVSSKLYANWQKVQKAGLTPLPHLIFFLSLKQLSTKMKDVEHGRTVAYKTKGFILISDKLYFS